MASLVALVAYTISALVPSVPVLYFLPRLGTWSWTSVPEEPSIRWYGCVMNAAVGGLLGACAGGLLRRRGSWTLLGGVALAILLVLSWRERGWFSR